MWFKFLIHCALLYSSLPSTCKMASGWKRVALLSLLCFHVLVYNVVAKEDGKEEKFLFFGKSGGLGGGFGGGSGFGGGFGGGGGGGGGGGW